MKDRPEREPAFAPVVEPKPEPDPERLYWLEKRRALITELRAVEIYRLGIRPSILSRSEREHGT